MTQECGYMSEQFDYMTEECGYFPVESGYKQRNAVYDAKILVRTTFYLQGERAEHVLIRP